MLTRIDNATLNPRQAWLHTGSPDLTLNLNLNPNLNLNLNLTGQAWLDMGAPTYPTPSQLAALEKASELAWEEIPHFGGIPLQVPANGLVVVDVAA